jgi:hypothetical protein
MFIINRCYDYDGDLMYNVSSVIGIYDKFDDAKQDLLNKLVKMKYEYEINRDDANYLFLSIIKKNGKDVTINKIICYEIIEKKLKLNELKMNS